MKKFQILDLKFNDFFLNFPIHLKNLPNPKNCKQIIELDRLQLFDA